MNRTATDNPIHAINIKSNITRKHCHESALMTTAHILVGLTQEGKSIEQTAREDFDNNIELISAWIDYMVGVSWIYNYTSNGNRKWVATPNGKKWVEKILQHYKTCD